jgi:pimeloyl-ACP methyl ester carboxylesterase
MQVDHFQYNANRLTFHALRMRGGKEPILFLHGFPDTPYSFLPLMNIFSSAGYDCIAPFMRGYFPTSVPQKLLDNPVATTQISELATDVIASVDSLGFESVNLIGHDWGSIAAYSAGNLSPKKIRRLVLLSVPPIPNFLKNTLSQPFQLFRSWYMFFFQLGFLVPETVIRHNNFEFLKLLWKTWSPLVDTTEYLEQAKNALAQNRHLSASLSYYRGLFRPALEELTLWKESIRLVFQPIEVPTLLIHGDTDGCIGKEIFQNSEFSFNSSFRKELIHHSGHFLQVEKPEEIGKLIQNFLS